MRNLRSMLLSLVCLAASCALAQPPATDAAQFGAPPGAVTQMAGRQMGGPGGRGGGFREREGHKGGPPRGIAGTSANPGGFFSEDLFGPELVMQYQKAIGLTDDQSSAIRSALQKTVIHFMDSEWQLAADQETLATIMKQEHPDEAKAIALLDKLMNAENEVKRARLQLLIRVKTALTAEQQAKLRELTQAGGREARMPGMPGQLPGAGPGTPQNPPAMPEGAPNPPQMMGPGGAMVPMPGAGMMMPGAPGAPQMMGPGGAMPGRAPQTTEMRRGDEPPPPRPNGPGEPPEAPAGDGPAPLQHQPPQGEPAV